MQEINAYNKPYNANAYNKPYNKPYNAPIQQETNDWQIGHGPIKEGEEKEIFIQETSEGKYLGVTISRTHGIYCFQQNYP
ncbi:MAG: hypothetical protein GY679_04615 [Mycoplasma sp.]|nr:hypothetical protein [Mycoplasma sp.]